MKGDSLRRQTELSVQYAQQHGLTLDDKLHLQDLGLSAFDRANIDRGALGAFLKLVEDGKIAEGSHLLVESLDRLSRDEVMPALEKFLSILRHGITIVTLSDGMVYNAEAVNKNFHPLLMSILVMQRAHEESLTKSKRIRAAWDNKRANIGEKKLTARCPGWLKLNSDKKSFSFIPERLAVVNEILGWSKSGIGQSVIIKKLNNRGEKNWSNHGDGWHPSYIAKILNSPALYGEFQPQIWNRGKLEPYGDPIPDYYPAVMSKEEFLGRKAVRGQRIFGGLGNGRKGADVPNLLSGIAKCGYCGGSMVMATSAAGRKLAPDGVTKVRPPQKTLVCDNGRRGKGCWAVRWSYQDFEKSFLSFCRGLELKNLLADAGLADDQERETKSLREQLDQNLAVIEDKQKKIANLIEAIENGSGSAALSKRLTQLEDEIERLQDDRKTLEKQFQASHLSEATKTQEIDAIKQLIDALDGKTGDELFTLRSALASMIQRTVKKVLIYPAGRITKPENLRHLEKELAEAGYSKKRIADHLKNYRTEPQRQNQEKGRYASRRDSGRSFAIFTHRDGVRFVAPQFEDPTKFDSDVENGRLNKAA